MDFMQVSELIVLVVLLATSSVQGWTKMSQAQEKELEMQLKLINKPAIKSFKTEYGDILDCVEIHKQLAFDHPLLKNHSIQMKPVKSSSVITKQNKLPRKLKFRCPKGTVLIRRVQKEDLLNMKSSHLFTNLKSSLGLKPAYSDPINQVAEGHQVATYSVRRKNIGVLGNINIWQPTVGANQFSSASVFVASDDGSLQNVISAGWSVNSALYSDNYTRLYTFWTKDSGKSGCFNILCPGYVQVSQLATPGLVIQPPSIYGGQQFEIHVNINQDVPSGNWWLNYGGEDIGYFPKELFTTLVDGADGGGWGGEVASPATTGTPEMGSGHFPEEGYRKSCYINMLKLRDPSTKEIIPSKNDLQESITKPECHKLFFDNGHMFFGGPANCIV